MADAASFPVGHQFIGIQGHFKVQVVVDHHLESLAFGAFAFVLVNGFPVDPAFRTETIAVDPAPGGQFFQKFRDQFFMVFFRDIPQSIFQRNFSLCRSQAEATIRSSPDAFLERFRFGQSVGELQFDGHGFSDFFIFHHGIPLLCVLPSCRNSISLTSCLYCKWVSSKKRLIRLLF